MALSKHLKPAKGLIQNDAGGLSFAVSDWTQLERFLILGTAGGTYYVSERKATIENAAVVNRCLELDVMRTLNTIVQIRMEGRAVKQEPCILALAIAASHPKSTLIRKAALSHITDICWTATQLFQFVEAVDDMRGWGETLRDAIAAWYNRPVDKIAYQMIKYRNREGWTHQDLMRKAHVKPASEQHAKLFRWAVREDAKELETGVKLVEAVQYLNKTNSVEDICRLIRDYKLPREAIEAKSTELLNDKRIWAALLPDMPMTAMIRNLAQMTAKDFLTANSAEAKYVCDQLREDLIKEAHIHPISLLSAFKVYGQGKGMKGQLAWHPVADIVDALEAGFYKAFKNVEPTDRARMVALDVSGSMAGNMVAGIPGLDARTVAAAVAMITINVEPRATLKAFSHQLIDLNIEKNDKLNKVVRTMASIPFGGTNCALPMIVALREKGKYDSFEVYTDAETWAGEDGGGWRGAYNKQDFAHLKLEQYRQQFNPKAKLVVVGMTSNGFTLADPNDPGMLDVVGCDPNTPRIISDFIKNDTWMN